MWCHLQILQVLRRSDGKQPFVNRENTEQRQLAETTVQVEDVGILSNGLPPNFFAQWESGKKSLDLPNCMHGFCNCWKLIFVGIYVLLLNFWSVKVLCHS